MNSLLTAFTREANAYRELAAFTRKRRRKERRAASILEHVQRRSGGSRYAEQPDFEPQATAEFQPTTALPGTAEKMAVIAERVRLGLPIWHPLDLKNHDGDAVGDSLAGD